MNLLDREAVGQRREMSDDDRTPQGVSGERGRELTCGLSGEGSPRSKDLVELDQNPVVAVSGAAFRGELTGSGRQLGAS